MKHYNITHDIVRGLHFTYLTLAWKSQAYWKYHFFVKASISQTQEVSSKLQLYHE